MRSPERKQLHGSNSGSWQPYSVATPLVAASNTSSWGMLPKRGDSPRRAEALDGEMGCLPEEQAWTRQQPPLSLRVAPGPHSKVGSSARKGIEGVWLHPNDDSEAIETIFGDQLLWADGQISRISQDSNGTFSTELEGTPRRAQLVGNQLLWEDKQVWTRLLAGPGNTLNENEATVPSDDVGRPRLPPVSKVPAQLSFMEGMDEEELQPLPLQALRDEEEWLERKRLTGAVGRLVRYKEGHLPANDIKGLCLTRQGRIMVTALQPDGPAARAGVTAGDQLASIDGKRFTVTRPANAMLAHLEGPVTLVFLGFAGKLQAEVRVRQPDQPSCGMPASADMVIQGFSGKGFRLAEAVIFEQQVESLFIATGSTREDSLTPMMHPLAQEELPSSGSPAEGGQDLETNANEALFELQREDARRVLKRAMKNNVSKTSLCTI